MILLLDTDILIDLALNRSPHTAPAAALLDALEQRPGTAFVAWHTLSNFYYLVAPNRGREGARTFLLELAEFIEVAPTTTHSLRQAALLPMRDFEDALQVAAAMACGAEMIVTRNLRDYARAPIRAVAPTAALAEIF